MKRNRFFLISLLFASSITVHAQDNAPKDSLTMESMMHNLPEVMVKGSRPIVKVERGMLTYNMPLLIKPLCENKQVRPERLRTDLQFIYYIASI